MATYEDVLYCVKFNLSGGDAPGPHLMAFRSTSNRAVASTHLKQIVDAHNVATPDNELTVQSMTLCTQEQLDEEVRKLQTGNPTYVHPATVYEEEKDWGKLIAPKKPAEQEA